MQSIYTINKNNSGQRQLMYWQPMKFNLVKSLRKDDALGKLFTADGNWFQMCEIMYAYEPWRNLLLYEVCTRLLHGCLFILQIRQWYRTWNAFLSIKNYFYQIRSKLSKRWLAKLSESPVDCVCGQLCLQSKQIFSALFSQNNFFNRRHFKELQVKGNFFDCSQTWTVATCSLT